MQTASETLKWEYLVLLQKTDTLRLMIMQPASCKFQHSDLTESTGSDGLIKIKLEQRRESGDVRCAFECANMIFDLLVRTW